MTTKITTEDLYGLIKKLVEKTDGIQKQNNEIKDELHSIKAEFSKEFDQLRQENLKLITENKKLKQRVLESERKLKKYNLIFYNIEEKNSESEDIQNFLDLINTKLHIVCCLADFRDIFRLGKVGGNRKRPILCELNNYKLKRDVLKASSILAGTGIFIANDLTHEDYEQQKILRGQLKIAKQNGHKAIIKKNKLYINGQEYSNEYLDGQEILVDQTNLNCSNENESDEEHIIRNKDINSQQQENQETIQQDIINPNSKTQKQKVLFYKSQGDRKNKTEEEASENTTKRQTRPRK